MRDKWISFGCFLTGINYQIISSCSEISKKRVVKYTSALLILCVIWTFVGYQFTNHYLKGAWYKCILGSLIMVFMVVQIERQIILSSKADKWLHRFRMIIAVAMAIIGTVIVDQIIFQEDINKKKAMSIDEEVNSILPKKAQELRRQIKAMDSTVLFKENERKNITDDVTRNPFIKVADRETVTDSSGNKTVTINVKQVNNPKFDLIEPIDATIAGLRKEKTQKDGDLLKLRSQVETELKSSVGLLDELEVMYVLLSESWLSFSAWFIWFVLLLFLELFIVVSKRIDTETDYDKRITQQMELHLRRIELLGRQPSA